MRGTKRTTSDVTQPQKSLNGEEKVSMGACFCRGDAAVCMCEIQAITGGVYAQCFLVKELKFSMSRNLDFLLK